MIGPASVSAASSGTRTQNAIVVPALPDAGSGTLAIVRPSSASARSRWPVTRDGPTDNELCYQGRPAPALRLACRECAPDVLRPSQGLEQFLEEDFMGGELLEPLSIWGFEIDRHPVGKAHGLQDLLALDSRHQFQMQISPVGVTTAQDGNGVQQPILRAHAAPGDTRAQKQPLCGPRLVQIDEYPGHFFRLEGHTAEIAPGAEGAVVAIALTGGGEQRFEQRQTLTSWHDRGLNAECDFLLQGSRRLSTGCNLVGIHNPSRTRYSLCFLGRFEGHVLA